MTTKFTSQSKYFSITVPTVIYGTAWNLSYGKKQLVGVWNTLALLYKEATLAADVQQKIKLEQHLHKVCQYETWIPGSTAECSAFAEAEINLVYGWFEFWEFWFTSRTATIQNTLIHRFMKKSSQTNNQFCYKSISTVGVTGMFRSQAKYLVVFHISSKRNRFFRLFNLTNLQSGKRHKVLQCPWLFCKNLSLKHKKIYNSRQQSSQLREVYGALIMTENQSRSQYNLFSSPAFYNISVYE